MNRLSIGLSFLVVTASLAGYAGSPFIAVHNLRSALISGNTDSIDDLVDFPSVRENLRMDLGAFVQNEITTDPELVDNPFAGLATAMAPAMVDAMISQFVTPEGMAAAMTAQRPGSATASSEDDADSNASDEGVETTFNYSGLDTFHVQYVRDESPTDRFKLTFSRKGLFSWELSRIHVPLPPREQ